MAHPSAHQTPQGCSLFGGMLHVTINQKDTQPHETIFSICVRIFRPSCISLRLKFGARNDYGKWTNSIYRPRSFNVCRRRQPNGRRDRPNSKQDSNRNTRRWPTAPSSQGMPNRLHDSGANRTTNKFLHGAGDRRPILSDQANLHYSLQIERCLIKT